MNRGTIYIIIAVVLVILSCKKQFAPALTSISTNFLAVDGPIISGDSTFIRLSRTTSLTDTTQNKAELKATVSVENDQNTLFPLIEKGKGLYVLGVTNFDVARKYRLNIKTNDGKIYRSDFVPMKVTPAIDSIYFKPTASEEITFYADAHDAANGTRYYRWDYKDTWAYVPIYHSNFQFKNSRISFVAKGTLEDISTCYRWANSNQIIIGSSAKLVQDEMKQQKIFSITNQSEKIAHVYTIQLHQYALTKEGFEYYQNLQTNTEQLGSIFDPQPSSVMGNIHCITNPAETVLGFVSASTVANRQYDLKEIDDPLEPIDPNFGITGIKRYAYPKPYYEVCATSIDRTSPVLQGQPWSFSSGFIDFTAPLPPALLARANRSLSSGDSLLFDVEFVLGSYIYKYAPKNCVDCRIRGGTNIRPSYFPPVR